MKLSDGKFLAGGVPLGGRATYEVEFDFKAVRIIRQPEFVLLEDLEDSDSCFFLTDVPLMPSPDDDIAAMTGVEPAVHACGYGRRRTARVTATVAENGRVTNVEVSGVPGSVGSCVAEAVRKAQFPRFQVHDYKVRRSFKL
jgi:hypothetical protein